MSNAATSHTVACTLIGATAITPGGTDYAPRTVLVDVASGAITDATGKPALLWSECPPDALLPVEAGYRAVTLRLAQDGEHARLCEASAALLRDIHTDLGGRDNPVAVSAQQLDFRPQAEFVPGSNLPVTSEAVMHGQMVLCGALFHVLAIEVEVQGGHLIASNPTYQNHVDGQYRYGGVPSTTRIDNRTYLLAITPQATP